MKLTLRALLFLLWRVYGVHGSHSSCFYVKTPAMRTRVFFLLFLFVISAYAVDHECGENEAIRRMILDKLGFDIHKVYRCCDAEGEAQIVRVDYERNPIVPLQTQIFYKTGMSQRMRVATASSSGFITGFVDISSFGNQPCLWKVAIEPYKNRPLCCATVCADASGLELTRYVFHRDVVGGEVFVRMSVQYSKLNEINLSWGTEVYGGVVALGDAANLQVLGRQTVNFCSDLAHNV